MKYIRTLRFLLIFCLALIYVDHSKNKMSCTFSRKSVIIDRFMPQKTDNMTLFPVCCHEKSFLYIRELSFSVLSHCGKTTLSNF